MFWRRTEKKIGEILVEAELITEDELKDALKRQREIGGRLGKILVGLGYIDEEELIQYIAEQYRIPYVSLDNYILNRDILNIIPEDLSKTYGVIPLDIIGDILTVGISDVPDERIFKRLEELTGYKIQVMLVTANDFARYMQELNTFLFSKRKELERLKVGNYIKTPSYKGIERRRFPRFDRELKIKYEFGEEYHIDSSINISQGGILLKTKCPIPVNSHLVVRMELPTSHKEIIVISKVVWVKHLTKEDIYLVGLNFISMDTKDSKRLIEFLK